MSASADAAVGQGRAWDAVLAEHLLGWIWVNDGAHNWLVESAERAREVVPMDVGSYAWGHLASGEDDLEFARLPQQAWARCPALTTDRTAMWRVIDALNVRGLTVQLTVEGGTCGCVVLQTATHAYVCGMAGSSDVVPGVLGQAALRAIGWRAPGVAEDGAPP